MYLQFYQEVFEEPFLEETREHYRRDASIIVANSDCYEYMEQVRGLGRSEIVGNGEELKQVD